MSVFIPIPKKGNAKECSNYHTTALISHTSKVMLRRRKWQPTPVFLPGKVHGQRSLAGCSPWDYMTEHVYTRVEGDGLVAIKW